MSYTSVFGGNTIYPSDVSYLPIALTVDTPLEWPLESSGAEAPAARIIDVTPDVSGWSIILPDATLTGAGQTILFNNIGGVYSFYVKDYAGNTLATVSAGTQWQVYLAATTTAAGTWRVFQYGASTATVQPSALAGFGLLVTGATLSQSLPVTTFATTGTTVATSNRASAFVWNSTGSGTLNLLTAASAGNNFFVFVRNEGGGDLTLDPSGSETINSAAALVLRPGDSATLITDGANWYTIGLGQEAVFAFDYTSISVTGGTVTLSGSQLNRITYKFVGALTSNCTIVVPSTVQQYWINNATTGSFLLFVKTSSGTPTQVNQGAKGIYYCDGTNIVLASDPTTLTTPIVVSDGGTGSTTASGARLNLGITTFADAIVTATTGASVRTTIGAAASGANSDITSLTGLTTPLSASRGGTGQTVYAVGDLLYASTTTALSKLADVATGNALLAGGVGVAPSWGKVGLTTHVTGTLVVANGGTGAATLTGYVKGTGTTAMTASATIPVADLTGTLAVANGGTGQTTYTDGQLLIGNSTGNTLAKATLTAGANITITNSAGGITIAAAGGGGGSVTSVGGTGTVNGITLTGTVTSTGNLTLGGTLSGVSLTTQVSGTLPVANGGTGATTAGAALTSLGAAASGANTDITALDQDVAVTATGTIAANTLGYRGLPQSANTTLALADAGKHIHTASNVTIPASSTAFPVGTVISIVNSGAATLTIGITTDTLRLAGTASTGTRTLAAYGIATAIKVATTVWYISGNLT